MMIRAYKAGFSLVELMVAMGIGLALLAGLVSVFANSSRAHRELQQTAQHLDNGRFAIETVSSDLQQAGFYGQFYDLPEAPAALPDPCEIATAANLYAALPVPAQLYSAPDYSTRAHLSATTCAAYGLKAANLLPGTDVLVIRRADGNFLAATDVPADGEVYIQSTVLAAEIQFGSSLGGSIGTTKKADGTPTELFTRRTGQRRRKSASDRVHIYFIAPCSLPADGGDVCTGAADDSGRPIPTLKRLELTASGGKTTMRIVPLAEGIENLQVEFGIDDTPTTSPALDGQDRRRRGRPLRRRTLALRDAQCDVRHALPDRAQYGAFRGIHRQQVLQPGACRRDCRYQRPVLAATCLTRRYGLPIQALEGRTPDAIPLPAERQRSDRVPGHTAARDDVCTLIEQQRCLQPQDRGQQPGVENAGIRRHGGN